VGKQFLAEELPRLAVIAQVAHINGGKPIFLMMLNGAKALSESTGGKFLLPLGFTFYLNGWGYSKSFDIL